MRDLNWPLVAAKGFGVLALSLGIGFLAGGISFYSIGREGMIYGGTFGHVSEIIGWGAGFLSAGLLTFLSLFLGRRSNPPWNKQVAHGARDEI